jgi:branched-chain amino acid transport system substrate-binding protein
LIQAIAAAGSTAATGISWAQGGAGDLNIALLSQSSGNFATAGTTMWRGASLAVEERGGKILGRKINLARRDDEGKPAVGVRRLSELIETEKTNYFAGNASSAVGLAESEVAAREKVIQYSGGGSDEFTGSRCNDYTFHWSVSPYTACSATLEYVRKQFPKAKRIYTLTVDYAFGHALLRNTQAVAGNFGFEHVGNDNHPLGERQYTQYFNKAIAAKPDVILLLTAGSDFLTAMRQLSSFGLKDVVIAAPWAAEIDELKELTPQMRAGLVLGFNYHYSIDSAVNKKFVVDYVKQFKEVPSYFAAYAYDSFRTLFLAMEKAKSIDPIVVAKALEGLKFDSVHGVTTIDARTHQTVRPYYVAVCKGPSEMKDASDIADLVYRSSTPQPSQLNQCKRTV